MIRTSSLLLSPPLSSSTTDVSVTSIISLTFVLCVKALLNSFVEQFRCVHVLVTLFGVSRPKLTNSNVTLYYVFPVTFGFFYGHCVAFVSIMMRSRPPLQTSIIILMSVSLWKCSPVWLFKSHLPPLRIPSSTHKDARAHMHMHPHTYELWFF